MAKKKTKTKVAEVVSKEIPPMPNSSPFLGAKTPAILAWRKKYEPEIYVLQYEQYVKDNKIELPTL